MYEFIASYRHARTRLDMAMEKRRFPQEVDDRPLGEIAIDASVWLAQFEAKKEKEVKLADGALAATAMTDSVVGPEIQSDAIDLDDVNFDEDELVAA